MWIEAGLWQHIQGIVEAAEGLTNVIFKRLATFQIGQKLDIVIMFWCLWRRHNEKVWEGTQKCPKISICLARESLME